MKCAKCKNEVRFPRVIGCTTCEYEVTWRTILVGLLVLVAACIFLFGCTSTPASTQTWKKADCVIWETKYEGHPICHL